MGTIMDGIHHHDMATDKPDPRVRKREGTDLSIIHIKNGWLVLPREFQEFNNASFSDATYAATVDDLGAAVVSVIGKQRVNT